MGRNIENHVSQNIYVRSFHFDTVNTIPCDYLLEYGTYDNQTVVIRSIQEFKDKLVVTLRQAFSKGEFHFSVHHTSQNNEWQIHLEHHKNRIGSIIYTGQGYLKSAQILDDNAKFVLVRSQTPPFKMVPVFFNDFPNLYRRNPQVLTNHRAVIYHHERQTTFLANWDNYDQISLTSTNQPTKDKKSITFPIYLPIKESNILHKHLEKASFPFELIRLLANSEAE